MTAGELEVLGRAHALFTGSYEVPDSVTGPSTRVWAVQSDGVQRGMTVGAHRDVAASLRAEWSDAHRVDAALARLLDGAHGDHSDAHRATGTVLAAARADAGAAVNDPIMARELLRRRVMRLRAQRAHVLAARSRTRRRRAELRALRYRLRGRRATAGDRRAEIAVRAALSRLGRPYVWGATGPDSFDCSGLVQWAYGQAGVPLHRTTYQQINDGVPIPRSQVRAGDLVFPHTGHVQLAIGGNLVIEAPQPGATVQISRLGPSVAIRRPT